MSDWCRCCICIGCSGRGGKGQCGKLAATPVTCYLSGVPRQRVNRALKLLEAAGLVEVRYSALYVLDLQGLMRFRLNDEQATLIDKLRQRGNKGQKSKLYNIP